MSQNTDDIRSFIAYRVTEGFDTVHEIIEETTAYASESFGHENIDSEIKRLTAEILADHRRKQTDWQGETDCEKLNRAFDALNEQRIVARQNFSCCLNCGHREIWDEIEEVETRHPVDGYVFYHLQCTEDAVKTGQLLMAYGSVEEDEECLQRVVHAVVQELQKVGLNAEWNGSMDSPISVNGLAWRRRR
ncbi:MAG: hypothetical protein GY904_13930 [Planctomycetaceae bacterium]|nr:hypothetical protein [Planctomycetaceae bacterium]